MITLANKLELHYFLRDETHTMNAFIRNECEKELLIIFKEVAQSLELNIEIESEAYKEGGLKEVWTFLGNHGVQITLLVTVLGIILSRIPVENKELVKLQIENLELDNEQKRQELRILKNNLKQEPLTEKAIEGIVKILDKDYKIIWHKSNFYKKLNSYSKVTKITTIKLNEQNKPVEKERTVERNQFSNLILRSDTFPPYIDEEALIDIISPVLKKGNFSWKGFYKGEIINFEMKDQDFKNSVLNKDIEFSNGTSIKCVLHQNRKIDETGLVKVIQNKVLTVIEIIIGADYKLTDQGMKFKREKKRINDQLKLDF